jgi:hypothetical protein
VVNASFGINEVTIEFTGSVGDLKNRVAPLFNLPDQIEVKVDGEWATMSTQVGAESSVEFIKPAGSKGI